jgi:hypothetical protein
MQELEQFSPDDVVAETVQKIDALVVVEEYLVSFTYGV